MVEQLIVVFCLRSTIKYGLNNMDKFEIKIIRRAFFGTVEECSRETGYSASHIRGVESGLQPLTDKYTARMCKSVKYEDCIRLQTLINKVLSLKGVYE